MTEEEYIIICSRVKITHAKKLLADALPGYGLTDDERKRLLSEIYIIEERLFHLVEKIERK